MPPSCIKRQKPKKKTRYKKTLLASLLLPSINITASIHNNIPFEEMIIQHGNLSRLGQRLKEQIKNKTPYNGLPFQLIYINAASSLTEQQKREIRQLLNTSHIIILDGTDSTPETIQATSIAIGGVGLSSPVIMIRPQKGAFPEYKHIVIPDTVLELNPQALNRLANESYRLLSTWRPAQHHARSARLAKSRWRPEATISIEQRYINLSCMVGSKFESRQSNEPEWTEGKTDACNRSASLSLNYTVDLIRSIPTHTAGTQDLKYLRITIDPENSGGTGWHLVNTPTHKHTWFESWANRETWFGPIADHYQIAIHSLDPDVHLYNAIPDNQPRETRITHRSSLQVGVMGQVIFQHPALADQDQENLDHEEMPADENEPDNDGSSVDDSASFYTAPEPDIALLEDVESDHDPNDATVIGETAGPSHDGGYLPQREPAAASYEAHDSTHPALHTQEPSHISEPGTPDPLDTKTILQDWKKIIDQSDVLKEQQKIQLYVRIIEEVTQDRGNPLENVNRRVYWLLGRKEDRYPTILQAFTQNPLGFMFDSKSRPSFPTDSPPLIYAKIILQDWDKIINQSDLLSQPQKQQLYDRIFEEMHLDSGNPQDNQNRREYWFFGRRKDRYPEILQAFNQNPHDFLFDSNSRPSFSLATPIPEPSASEPSTISYPHPVPVIEIADTERSEYHHNLSQIYPSPGKPEKTLVDSLFNTWRDIINDTDVLTDTQKSDLLKYILLNVYKSTNNQLEDISRREYWLIGLSPQYSEAILTAFAENPEGFKYGDMRPVLPATSKLYQRRLYRHQTDLMSAFSYSSIRSLQYNNYEYAVINQSKAGLTDTAKWVWTRDFQRTGQHWRSHVTCPLWCQDWFFKDSAFSPAAYAHFTPGFSATFMVPASKQNTSSFIFSATVKPVALGGRVNYRFLFQEYSPWSQSGDTQTVSQLLTVKWGSPIFHPEAPVTLKIQHQNRCLNVRENSYHDGSQVNLYKCRNLNSQLWGHDDSFRLKPHSAPGQCLTRNDNNALVLHSCTYAENQKWYWNHDRLMNSQGCYLSMISDDTLSTDCDEGKSSRWSLKIPPKDSHNTLLISPL
ncbi:hypothetical protein GCM10023116_36320 [Kistimonas scapharcae]|uniref:Ricin B lectin domain-containing protein n=1 Tax=Kistimonas scapharcae TaxID=1036133 RepID=A0ABP8V512_9GAMM